MSCQLCKIFIGGELNAIFAQQQLRHELGIPLSATVLLSVGEVNRNKNHAICIKALAKLHLPNVYYVICGSGPLMQKNQQLAKKLGIAKQVILLVTIRTWLFSTKWQIFSFSHHSVKDYPLP